MPYQKEHQYQTHDSPRVKVPAPSGPEGGDIGSWKSVAEVPSMSSPVNSGSIKVSAPHPPNQGSIKVSAPHQPNQSIY